MTRKAYEDKRAWGTIPEIDVRPTKAVEEDYLRQIKALTEGKRKVMAQRDTYCGELVIAHEKIRQLEAELAPYRALKQLATDTELSSWEKRIKLVELDND